MQASPIATPISRQCITIGTEKNAELAFFGLLRTFLRKYSILPKISVLQGIKISILKACGGEVFFSREISARTAKAVIVIHLVRIRAEGNAKPRFKKCAQKFRILMPRPLRGTAKRKNKEIAS